MKLVSLHIINFGKLHDFKYSFNDNLNEILQDNGWGKSTLADFIKAMLYGIENKTKSFSNPRKKYAPWNKQLFGGSLIIELDNKQYKIERTFDASKSTNDTFKLIDLKTNLESSKYSTRIGEEILLVNEEGFNRSVYIPQKVLELKLGESVTSSLANIIGGSDDVGDYEYGNKIIDDKIKKYKGKNGLIDPLKLELKEINYELKSIEQEIALLPSYNQKAKEFDEKITLLNEEIKLIDKDIIMYGKISERNARIETYNKMKKEILLVYENKKNIENKLNGHELTIEEIEKYFKDYSAYKIKKAQCEKVAENIHIFDLFKDEEVDIIMVEKEVDEYYKEDVKVNYFNIFTVISSILLLVSIVTFILEINIVAIISLVVGLVLLVLGITKPNKVVNKKSDLTLRKIFSKYNIYDEDYKQSLLTLKTYLKDYNLLKENQTEYQDNELIVKRVNKFLLQFDLTGTDIESKFIELRNILYKIHHLDEDLNKRNIELKEYSTKNNLDEIIDSKILDINALKEKRSTLEQGKEEVTREKQTILNHINNCENLIVKSDEIVEKKDEIETKIQTFIKEKEILELTKDLLKEANENMLAKYLKPMKDSLNKYLNLLIKNKVVDYSLSLDFDLKLNEDGFEREMDYFSIGEQELYSLCMRLALIDVMYQKEKPMIILDDPFVNFDEQRLINCKNLIKDIAKEYQILYLSCHSSRSI